MQHNDSTATISYKVRKVQQPPHVFDMRSDAICVDKPRVLAVYFDIGDCEYDVPLHIVPEDLPVQDLRLSWVQDQASPWLAW